MPKLKNDVNHSTPSCLDNPIKQLVDAIGFILVSYTNLS